MKSILANEDNKSCWLCGATHGEHLDRHHVYGGGMRQQSEKYGLVVYLCHSSCHEYGERAVHQNKVTRELLQAQSQKRAMEYYGWSVKDWMDRFYKNYMEDFINGV